MCSGVAQILYAEDDPNDVLLVERLVCKSQLAIDLRIVNNGQEAIEWLDGRDQYADRTQFPMPALLITDLKMPNVDGYQLLSWVRSNPNHNTLPVIVYTSSNLPEDYYRCHLLGADEFVVKSALCEELIEVLMRRLGNSAQTVA